MFKYGFIKLYLLTFALISATIFGLSFTTLSRDPVDLVISLPYGAATLFYLGWNLKARRFVVSCCVGVVFFYWCMMGLFHSGGELNLKASATLYASQSGFMLIGATMSILNHRNPKICYYLFFASVAQAVFDIITGLVIGWTLTQENGWWFGLAGNLIFMGLICSSGLKDETKPPITLDHSQEHEEQEVFKNAA